MPEMRWGMLLETFCNGMLTGSGLAGSWPDMLICYVRLTASVRPIFRLSLICSTESCQKAC
eukprot:12585222-Alexandrium_andersonii.AAC.1